jgi:hypothetical protein
MSKLGFYVALALGGIIATVARFVIKAVAKSSSQATIEKIKRNPSYATKVAAELDIPVSSKENFTATDFQLLRKYLSEQPMVANYEILHVADVDSTQFIIFTNISFVDFDVNIIGKGSDIDKTEYLTFLASHDNASKSLTIRSEVYHNANDKFVKEGFLKAVFNGTAVLQN